MFWIFVLLAARLVWRLILRASAYPEFIPTRTKRVHAFVIFYVFVGGCSGLNQLLWLLTHSQSHIWSSQSLVTAYILEGLAGGCLMFVSTGMARRQKSMLRWYFLLWPVTFLSQSYVASVLEQGVIRSQSIVIGTVLAVGFGIMTLAFYLFRSSKIIFEEVSHVA